MLRSFVNLGIENSIEGGRSRWTSARVCFKRFSERTAIIFELFSNYF